MKFDRFKSAYTAGLLLLVFVVSGQDTFPKQVDHMYGLDKDLLNGIQYYNRYLRSQDHPYFLWDRFEDGSVSIKGKIFQPVSLKFNLFEQDLELEYEAFTGGFNRLILITDHVDSFSLGDYKFRKMKIGDKAPTFYQEISLPQFRCLVYWEKKIIPLSNNTNYTQEFSKSRRTFWLELGKKEVPFHNRRSFVVYFPEDKQKEIRKIFRQKGFSFRNATPDELIRTMKGVSELLTNGGLP